MISDDGRKHVRINVTPASMNPDKCFTIANLHMARLNWQMLSRGGTFLVQFEDVLAYNESIQYQNRDTLRLCSESIVKQMSHYGIKLSEPDLFAALDMPDSTGVMYESEWEQVVNAVWRYLLPFRDWMGPTGRDWPPVFPDGAHSCLPATDDKGIPNGIDGFRGIPVRIIVGRVVRDMIAQRNYFINGSECQHYKSEYNTICNMLRIPPPLQLTAPLLYRRTEDGQERLISTSDSVGNPYYVTEAMNAGVTYQELWGFISQRVFVKQRLEQGFTYGGGVVSQSNLDEMLLPRPVIDDTEWEAVLDTARTRKAKAAEVKAAAEAKAIAEAKAAEAEQEKQQLKEIEEQVESRAKELAETIISNEVKRLEYNYKQREARARKKASNE